MFVSIVLFSTLPKKMLAVQKRLIDAIFRQETGISSAARSDQHVEQTLVQTPDNAPSIRNLRV